MSFRDELDAARARRDALQRSSGDPEIARELAAVRAEIDEARGRVALRVLQDVRVATPCPASWAAMVGDDAVRHCALCEKKVYDFSGLTAIEAVHLLVAHEGNACVRLYRRRDGTLITADCEVGRRRRRTRWLRGAAASLAIGGAAAIASPGAPSSRAQPRPIVESDSMRIDEQVFLEGLVPRRVEPEPQTLQDQLLAERRAARAREVIEAAMGMIVPSGSVTMGAPLRSTDAGFDEVEDAGIDQP